MWDIAQVSFWSLQVTIREVSAKKLTLRMLLTARGGGGADVKGLLWMLLTNPVSVLGTLGFSALPMLLQVSVLDSFSPPQYFKSTARH